MAEGREVEAEVPVPPILKKRVELTLSINEAETLALVLAKCGGDPTTTRRKHTDAIGKALGMAGYSWQQTLDRLDPHNLHNDMSPYFDAGSSIYFKPSKNDSSKD